MSQVKGILALIEIAFPSTRFARREITVGGSARDAWEGVFYEDLQSVIVELRTWSDRFFDSGASLFASSPELSGRALDVERDQNAVIVFVVLGVSVRDIAAFARTGVDHDQGTTIKSYFESRKGDVRFRDVIEDHSGRFEKIFDRLSKVAKDGVGDLLVEIEALARFRILFADSRGMHLRFCAPVSYELAHTIETLVLAVDPEAAAVTDPRSLADVLNETQELQLWWD